MKKCLIIIISLVILVFSSACYVISIDSHANTGLQNAKTEEQVLQIIDETNNLSKDSITDKIDIDIHDNIQNNTGNESNYISENEKENPVSQDMFQKEEYNEKVNRIKELVQPSIVYGTMLKDDGEFKKGEQVEVIRDKGNGRTYYVSSGDKKGWINGKNISIPEDFLTIENRMEKEDMEFFVNEINDFNSKTNYFIWIDLSRQLVNIFKGEKGNWELIHSFLCATGKNKTPTVRGTFEVNGRGLRFGNAVGAKNWVRFYGNYLLHSITIDAKGNILDSTLGKRASHGCVRLSMEDSKWVYDNIPDGTTVWIN